MYALAAVLTVLAPGHTRPAASAVDTAAYRIDLSHSDITFRIRHMVSRVAGTFNDWSGIIKVNAPDWTTGSVDVEIKSASIDTRHAARDRDLRSANFFDAERWPTIRFRSRHISVEGNALLIAGDLSLHGVTRPVVLRGEFLGSMGMGPGKERLGFTATTTIDRTEFGVTWNRALEGGGALLGDEVEVSVTLQAVRM